MQITQVNWFRARQIPILSRGIPHAIVWALFIFYEITLAAAITNKFGHFLDYLLHYALYICLFYFHCYLVLIPSVKEKGVNWYLLSGKLLCELVAFFSSNVLIYLLMEYLNVSALWPINSPVFIYTNIYRAVFILGASTGYWIYLERNRKRKRLNRMQHSRALASVEKQKLRADMIKVEHDFLKSQINPHMLFNTLNFIYNEVRKVDKPIADHIMSLSELMQYSLTGLDKDLKIPLQDELDYIEHYIRLYCQRIPLHVELIKEGSTIDFQQKIIPLVLATVVENLFQHGDLTDPLNKGLVHVLCNENRILIKTWNKVRHDRQAGHGFGLNNTRKRLDHTYPDAFSLEHGLQGSSYTLELTIHLK